MTVGPRDSVPSRRFLPLTGTESGQRVGERRRRPRGFGSGASPTGRAGGLERGSCGAVRCRCAPQGKPWAMPQERASRRLVRRPKHVAQQAASRSGRPFAGKTACVDQGRLTMARLRCRLRGHAWVLQEGISALMPEAGHEHDVFYECSRCQAGEWRPLDLSWSGVPAPLGSGRRRQGESARAAPASHGTCLVDGSNGFQVGLTTSHA